MKTRIPLVRFWLAAGAFSVAAFAPGTSSAADAAVTVAPQTASAATVTTSAQERLPYGVEDVLKLSRAQVSEDIILTYVQNSGTIYTLGPKDIVYLRDQGVSDRVVNTMLDQRRKFSEAAAQQAATQAPAAPIYQDNGSAPSGLDAQQQAPLYPEPAEVQPAPASSVYVIPYPGVRSAYYGYGYRPYSYGYYQPYYSYGPSFRFYTPGLSFGFGFGGRGGGHFRHHR
jgi:hypothetical protein